MTDHLFWYPGQDLSLPDMVKAKGTRVYDKQGKAYLDMESGVWCTVLGHNHPEVTAALTEQAGTLAHTGFNYGAGIVTQAARELLDCHGFGGGRAVFLCSGSEAVEYMVRCAAEIMPAPLFLTMSESYFGAYGSAKERGGSWVGFDWTDCSRCNASCSLSCPCLEPLDFERIGAFVFEPGSGGGPVLFPPKKLIQTISDAVRDRGGLVLVNEVTTGMGRTGKWWGYDHYGITPDMAAMGKGLGNGYPVSAAAVSADAAQRLGKTGIAYAQSHQNDPMGAAAARAVIRVLKAEDLVPGGAEKGEMLLAGIRKIQERAGMIRKVRARGLMIAMDIRGEASDAERVRLALLDRGIIVGHRAGLPVLRIDPPLILTRKEAEEFLIGLEAALAS